MNAEVCGGSGGGGGGSQSADGVRRERQKKRGGERWKKMPWTKNEADVDNLRSRQPQYTPDVHICKLIVFI